MVIFRSNPPEGESRSQDSPSAPNPIARAAAFTTQAPAPSPDAAEPAATQSTSAAQAAEPPVASAPLSPWPEAAARPAVVGRLTHVHATRLWGTDAQFAAWLADNPDALRDELGLTLEGVRTVEGAPGLVTARHVVGGSVVIVCERDAASDLGFGRLVRHVAASGAEHGVWICGEADDEHRASVSWLNRSVDGRFSLLKVSGVTIGDSAAAPMFEVLVRSAREEDPVVDSRVPSADSAPGAARRAEDWLVDRLEASSG